MNWWLDIFEWKPKCILFDRSILQKKALSVVKPQQVRNFKRRKDRAWSRPKCTLEIGYEIVKTRWLKPGFLQRTFMIFWKDMPAKRVSPAWQRSQWDRRSWRGWSGRSRQKPSARPAALTGGPIWSGRRCSGWAEGIRAKEASAENYIWHIWLSLKWISMCQIRIGWWVLNLPNFEGEKQNGQIYSELIGIKMSTLNEIVITAPSVLLSIDWCWVREASGPALTRTKSEWLNCQIDGIQWDISL